MQWAWVLGLVSLSGPTLVLAAFARLDSIIYALLPSKDYCISCAVTQYVGWGIAFLFMPLVMAHTSGGLFIAIWMLSLSSVLAIWVLAPLIGQLFQGVGNTSKLTMWVVCSLIGLSLVLPFGLFNGWHWGVSGILLLFSAVTYWFDFKTADVSEDVEDIVEFVDADNPFLYPKLIQSHQDCWTRLWILSKKSRCVSSIPNP